MRAGLRLFQDKKRIESARRAFNLQGARTMEDDEEQRAERIADRHIARVKRDAGEGAHVEGVEYEGGTAEGEYPQANFEPQDRDPNLEGAPLEAPDTDRDE